MWRARQVTVFALRLAVTGVLAAVLGLMAWAVIPLAAGWHGRVVLSGSMEPAIQPGDVMLTVGVDPSKLRPGEAIAFRDPARPGRVDIHRLVSRASDGTFITRGDANGHDDSTPVRASDIIGLPRLRIPWVGLPQYWLRSHDYVKAAASAIGLTIVMCLVVSTPRRHDSPGGRHRRPRETTPAVA